LRFESLRLLARAAEGSERYEDMVVLVKHLIAVKKTKVLSLEERNLLSVAYKNVVGLQRAAWRALADAQQNASCEEIKAYAEHIRSELRVLCQEVIDIVESLLETVQKRFHVDTKRQESEPQHVQQATHGVSKSKLRKFNETQVFYLKMLGDYHRYYAETKPLLAAGADPDTAPGPKAGFAYRRAAKIAQEFMSPTHPVRLGLYLNYAVCLFEVLKKPADACAVAEEAFNAAIANLSELNKKTYKDATLIMQLLRDNLELWRQSIDDSSDI
jgi:hypothetical protein